MSNVRLVIPCFNEEHRLPAQDFVDFLSEQSTTSLSFVNDGSTDATLAVLRQIEQAAPERVDVIDLEQNSGKAEAVRQGVLAALRRSDFDFVGYFDADLATPLDQVAHLLSASGDPPEHSLIFGSRIRGRGAQIDRDPVRHFLGRSFSVSAALALSLDFHDTQCGAKLFSRDIAASVFAEPFISRRLFDLELFARTRALLGKATFAQAVLEVPLEKWEEKGTSRIRKADLIRVPRDLFRIWATYRGA